MKKSLRPLFSLVLLIAVGTALSCRAAVRRNLNFSPPELRVSVIRPPILNQTLLSFAAVELGEAESREEINRLLEGNYGYGRHRSISSYGRENHDTHRRAIGRIPAQLLHPRYTKLWPSFRENLRNWARSKRFQPDIMKELMAMVKQPLDRHYGSTGLVSIQSGPFYSSCAVVGNSGILLKKDYAEFIDSHEMVIRLNNARTEGFHKKVGSKTTLAFVNSNMLHYCARREGCFCHPYGEQIPIVMYICQPAHFMDYVLCNLTHKAPLIITDVRFDVLCARIVKYYSIKDFVEKTGKPLEDWAAAHDGSIFHYSSGMQAIMLALGICEKVSIFGFGKSNDAKHHYHTNQKAELHLHDYEAEYIFYDDLVNRPEAIPFLRDAGFKIPPVTIYY
ncbi:beta-1,6-galactosyltransferase GALT29A [Amborella trichopoda]|uniref:Uncharacterized protein n=1 Tax=Amborella trichopoda TaxID=13333 RepID=W1PYL3_AMBTC|nr:beta-1,6-galactosyltransferase GALT29A [Amborella trichopoda]ERN13066.1 hypothetical protein AMTR_s00040p00141670 [Amborella trichopoda]|eukprot:XP_006851485.1 beta-1,6-galactosyltransferase GALT29A [Amborella trichopoda]